MDLSNENVIHVKGKGIEYLQFKRLLEYPNVTHVYVIGLDKNFRTARINQEMSKEELELAKNSYKTLCNELNLDYNNIVKTNQTHSKNVEKIENTVEGGIFSPVYKNTDGLITNKKDIVLSTTNADCILLIFYDPVKNVIANIHSGWKGTLQRISVNAVEKMKEEYGCNTNDIICCMCPSIRKCHFEVDQDVYEMFYNEFQDLENINDIIEKTGDKWHIDTILINRTILNKCGLKKENIIDSEICSVCNKDIIHSFRAEGANYGLTTAVVSLKERK